MGATAGPVLAVIGFASRLLRDRCELSAVVDVRVTTIAIDLYACHRLTNS